MRARPAVTLALVGLLCLGLISPASADGEKDRKARLDARSQALQHDLDETSAELRQAGRALGRAESRLPGAQARVAEVHGRLEAAAARSRVIAAQLVLAKAEVAKARAQIDDTLASIEDSRAVIGRIARSSYQTGGMGELAVVLQSQSPDQFATRLVLVQSALRSEGSILGGLAEDRADLAAQKATLVAKREQVAATKARQDALVVRITSLQAQAVQAQQAVETLISEREAAVQTIAQQKATEEARYATMRAESARLGRILAARARAARAAAARARARSRAAAGSSGGGSSSSGGGTLSYPVSAPVTSPYGMRVHPVTGIYKLHDGTDFGVGCGTPVHAAASGTVIQTANVPGYGNQLVVDNGIIRGAGVATSYNHLSSFAVGYGTRVSRGQVIAYSGGGEGMAGAGYSTGCHLHFMVYVNGGTTDPMGWL